MLKNLDPRPKHPRKCWAESWVVAHTVLPVSNFVEYSIASYTVLQCACGTTGPREWIHLEMVGLGTELTHENSRWPPSEHSSTKMGSLSIEPRLSTPCPSMTGVWPRARLHIYCIQFKNKMIIPITDVFQYNSPFPWPFFPSLLTDASTNLIQSMSSVWCFPASNLFNLGKRLKSHKAKSGNYDTCGIILMPVSSMDVVVSWLICGLALS